MKYRYFIPLLKTAFLPSLIYKKLKTMNINNYVKKFGKYDFKQLPFNEVDALILCTAIYSNFEVIAPSIIDIKSKPFFFKDITNYDLSVITAGRTLLKGNKKLIPLIRNSNRYSNIGIKYLSKIFYPEYANQFYAVTYIIPDVGSFIVFRGTDSSITGWEENIHFGINKIVLSQLDALEYLSTIAKLEKGPIYVGGQSKGGNLALFSSIHINEEVQDRIIKGYSFDGNGLNDDSYLLSKEYLRIKDKFYLYAPSKSIVSEILTNTVNRIYVKAKGMMLKQHSPYKWIIDKHTGKFVTVKDKCKKSYIIHEALDKWISSLSKYQKKIIISFVSAICGERKKTIFKFIFSPRCIFLLIENYRKLNILEKTALKDSMRLFLKSYKDAKRKNYRKNIQLLNIETIN